MVRIPVLHEDIEGSLQFIAVLQRCEDSHPELTGVAFVAPSMARVVLSQQTQPSELHDATMQPISVSSLSHMPHMVGNIIVGVHHCVTLLSQ